jgi:fibronectin type 3 domain-containing protein
VFSSRFQACFFAECFTRFVRLLVLLATLRSPLALASSPGLALSAGEPPAQSAPVTRVVHLTWEASTDEVVGYRVYRGTTDGGPYTSYTQGPVADLSFDDITAETNQSYYYVVTALDANGVESGYSNQIAIFVPRHIVHLTWSASTDNVIGYRVYRSTMDGGPYVNYTIGPVEFLAFDDVTGVPGTTYYYVVTSLDFLGDESAFSDQIAVSVPEP